MNTFINNIKFVFGLLAVVCIAGVVPTPVRAETTQCTVISSLPYTITTQGVYCLKDNLNTAMTSGDAITINANNVTIDLNGYKIGGLAAGAGTLARGIYAYQRKNITIKNGIIRGFLYGIYLNDTYPPSTTSQGHLIEGIRADQNTYIGIEIDGSGNEIRNCTVVSTGGSTAVARGPITSAYGINVEGSGSVVSNNTVIDTVEQAGGSGYGIFLAFANGTEVESNHVANAALGPGTSYGVYTVYSTRTSVVNNNIVNFTNGIYIDNATVSTGLYRDNLVSGCTTPFTGGTAAGTTNYSIP